LPASGQERILRKNHQHLSETVELLRTGQIASIDIAIIEAIAITDSGAIIPTTSVAPAPASRSSPTK
jgi:acyl-CoA hydrolase